jgi:hypothetical protein
MKAQELRIGNYVNVPHGDVQIEYFVKEGAHFTDGNGGSFNSLHPITLTEEWLLRFGFIRQTTFNNLPYSDFGRFRIYWPSNASNASLHFRPNETEWFPIVIGNLEDVHQLQNLYHALCNEELIIK